MHSPRSLVSACSPLCHCTSACRPLSITVAVHSQKKNSQSTTATCHRQPRCRIFCLSKMGMVGHNPTPSVPHHLVLPLRTRDPVCGPRAQPVTPSEGGRLPERMTLHQVRPRHILHSARSRRPHGRARPAATHGSVLPSSRPEHECLQGQRPVGLQAAFLYRGSNYPAVMNPAHPVQPCPTARLRACQGPR